jgi:hypothetical protein
MMIGGCGREEASTGLVEGSGVTGSDGEGSHSEGFLYGLETVLPVATLACRARVRAGADRVGSDGSGSRVLKVV